MLAAGRGISERGSCRRDVKPAADHPSKLRVVPFVVLHAVMLAPAIAASAITLAEPLHVMVRPQHPGEHHETALLLVVEALIKRRTRVGDLLQCGASLGHGVGPPGQPIERCRRRLILIGAILHGLNALDTQLNEIPNSLLEWRPIFRLIRSQFKAGLERSDTRVGKGRNIRGAQPVVLHDLRPPPDPRSPP